MRENTTQLREEFERDGFLILRDFLSQEELLEVTKRAEICVSRCRERTEQSKQKAFIGTYKNLQGDDPWFEEMINSGRPKQMVASLFDKDLYPMTVGYFSRIPGEEQGIDPHYDALGHRMGGATLWISLDRSTVENGCLYYLKGSHREHYESKLGLEVDESTTGATPIELEPGDAAVHHSLTVHWSRANKSQLSRRGVNFFYFLSEDKGKILDRQYYRKKQNAAALRSAHPQSVS